MKNQTTDESLKKTSRIVGLLFLLSLIVPSLNWTFVTSKFIVAENAIATANRIMSNELLFSIGITNEIIISVLAVVLAIALYLMLKPVSKNLALLALYLKLVEAILWIVIALVSFISLLILKSQASFTGFGSEQIQTLIGLFLNSRTSVNAIPMVFLGLNLMVFLYLLFKSKYVPIILSGFGILSYALIFIYALITILSPNYAVITMQIFWGAPSVLFELVIGIWLLFKGINVQQKNTINE